MDVEDVEKFGLASGIGYNISDAITINGQPGLLYNCSQQGIQLVVLFFYTKSEDHQMS